MVPALLRFGKLGPQRNILKKKSTKVLHLSICGKFNPWMKFMELAEQVLEVSVSTPLVLESYQHNKPHPSLIHLSELVQFNTKSPSPLNHPKPHYPFPHLVPESPILTRVKDPQPKSTFLK